MGSELAVKMPVEPTRFVIELAEVVDVDAEGRPVVVLNDGSGLAQRASYVSGGEREKWLGVGSIVLVAVDEAASLPPIVLAPVTEAPGAPVPGGAEAGAPARNKLVFEADRSIELRCGKSSITLTREGKVIVKGVDIVSRASGANKIKGASVNIN